MATFSMRSGLSLPVPLKGFDHRPAAKERYPHFVFYCAVVAETEYPVYFFTSDHNIYAF